MCQDAMGRTPLQLAQAVNPSMCRLLVAAEGANSILTAAMDDDVDEIEASITRLPSSVWQRDGDGWQPLFWAVLNNSLPAVRVLINAYVLTLVRFYVWLAAVVGARERFDARLRQ